VENGDTLMKKTPRTILDSVCLLLICLLTGGAKVVASANKTPLAISKVGLDRKIFNPSNGENISLSFEINKKANVQVTIIDRLEQQVSSVRKSNLEQGRHSITWGGRRSDGKLAQGRVFLYVIQATAGLGEKAVYNPAEQTGGLVVRPHTYTFDRKSGRIEYVLPKACMVRLRAGLSEGMLVRTIFDWEPRTAGRHIYKWDGRDGSGFMNLSNHPELNLNLTCYTLPSNTIITTGKVASLESEGIAGKIIDKRKLWATKGKYLHYQHDPRFCREPRFNILFPAKKKNDSEGIPVVNGTTPIRIELDRRDAWYLINKRFEVILYIDGTFFFEMEEGTNPFTFNWDTQSFTKGVHIITANLRSYDDHVGVVTKKVFIGEE
jgi:flagellar hook assembly protein FlgD